MKPTVQKYFKSYPLCSRSQDFQIKIWCCINSFPRAINYELLSINFPFCGLGQRLSLRCWAQKAGDQCTLCASLEARETMAGERDLEVSSRWVAVSRGKRNDKHAWWSFQVTCPTGEVTAQATTAGDLVVNGLAFTPRILASSLSTNSPHTAISGPRMGKRAME